MYKNPSSPFRVEYCYIAGKGMGLIIQPFIEEYNSWVPPPLVITELEDAEYLSDQINSEEVLKRRTKNLAAGISNRRDKSEPKHLWMCCEGRNFLRYWVHAEHIPFLKDKLELFITGKQREIEYENRH